MCLDTIEETVLSQTPLYFKYKGDFTCHRIIKRLSIHNNVTEAWGVFYAREDNLLLSLTSKFKDTKGMPYNKWIRSNLFSTILRDISLTKNPFITEDNTIQYNDYLYEHFKYPRGFHKFTNIRGASSYLKFLSKIKNFCSHLIIKKVYLFQIHTIGTQSGDKCYVSNWMYIPEN